MSNEFASYPALEWTHDEALLAEASAEGLTDIVAELATGPCWKLSVFGICLESWSGGQLTLGFYLQGIKIGQKTIKVGDPCIRLRKSVGPVKVDAEVCADFTKREVVARGSVCAFGACVRFNQVIFRF